MNDLNKRSLLKLAALTAVASAALIGCGKKEEAAAPAAAPAPAPAAPAPAAATPHDPTRSPSAGLPHASPSVRKFARELGVPLEEVKGSGPKGRITQEDVQGFTKAVMSGQATTKASAAAKPAAGGGADGAALGLLPWPKSTSRSSARSSARTCRASRRSAARTCTATG